MLSWMMGIQRVSASYSQARSAPNPATNANQGSVRMPTRPEGRYVSMLFPPGQLSHGRDEPVTGADASFAHARPPRAARNARHVLGFSARGKDHRQVGAASAAGTDHIGGAVAAALGAAGRGPECHPPERRG